MAPDWALQLRMDATRMAVTQDPAVQLDAMSALFRHSGGEPKTHEMLTGLAVFIARLEEAHSVTTAHVEAAVRMAAETSDDDLDDELEEDVPPAVPVELALRAASEVRRQTAVADQPPEYDDATLIGSRPRRFVSTALTRPATALAAFALMAAVGGAGWMAYSDGAEQPVGLHADASPVTLASRSVSAGQPAPEAAAAPAATQPAVAEAVPPAPPPPPAPAPASPPQLAADAPAEPHETEPLKAQAQQPELGKPELGKPELGKPDIHQAETAPEPLPLPPVPPPVKQAEAVSAPALPVPPPIPVETNALPPHAPPVVAATPAARPRSSPPTYLRHADRDYRVYPREAPLPPAEAAAPESSTAYSALVDELRRNALALGRPVAGPPVPAPPPVPAAAPPPQQHYVGSYVMGPDGRRIFVTSP